MQITSTSWKRLAICVVTMAILGGYAGLAVSIKLSYYRLIGYAIMALWSYFVVTRKSIYPIKTRAYGHLALTYFLSFGSGIARKNEMAARMRQSADEVDYSTIANWAEGNVIAQIASLLFVIFLLMYIYQKIMDRRASTTSQL